MSEPNEPTPPPRIILPGAEDETPSERPRIILPPGSVPDSRDDLPEYPRLRAVQIHAMREGERELLVITDPLGVASKQLVLGLETLAILEMLDGVRGEAETRALIVQENRRYARRQLIWFRKEPNLVWFDGPGETTQTIARVCDMLSVRLTGPPSSPPTPATNARREETSADGSSC